MNAKILARKEHVLDEDMHFPRFLLLVLKSKLLNSKYHLLFA